MPAKNSAAVLSGVIPGESQIGPNLRCERSIVDVTCYLVAAVDALYLNL